MGYSTSKSTLLGFREHLSELEQGRTQLWLTEVGNEEKLAYKIREALSIAKLYPAEFPALAAAADKFEIQPLRRTGKVQAVIRDAGPSALSITMGSGVVTHGLETARRPVVTAGKQTAFTVIDSWRKAQPTNDPLRFPNAQLEDHDLAALYNWAQSQPVRLMLMVDGEALTLSVADEEVEKYAWKPRQSGGTDVPDGSS